MRPANWVALFSQSGRELISLYEKFGYAPEVILTNSRKADAGIFKLPGKLIAHTHASLMDDLAKLINTTAPVVTLHGYLRILPPDITAHPLIYNGHPGLITKYPNLKGKDPQETVWMNLHQYDEMGAVVHKVTNEVDGGEILVAKSIPVVQDLTKEQVYAALKMAQQEAWMEFFNREYWKR